MMMWDQPEYVEGGRWRFDPTCWAAAMSTWQSGSDRDQETVAGLYKRLPQVLKAMPRGGQKTLDGDKFDTLMRAKNIEMAWRPITGANLIKWDLETLLDECGYVYCVFKVEKGLSHACVMFGADSDTKTVYFMDPATRRTPWPFAEIAKFKWMVAVAKECTPFGDGWQNPGQ